MAKLQQFSFVCAPSMVQYAGVVALDRDLTAQIDAYRRKRDVVVAALADDFDLAAPEGAFYAFPRAPWGTGDRVRRRGDPPQPADHPRQRLQPPRHPLPDLVRRRRRDARRGLECSGSWRAQAALAEARDERGVFGRGQAPVQGREDSPSRLRRRRPWSRATARERPSDR